MWSGGSASLRLSALISAVSTPQYRKVKSLSASVAEQQKREADFDDEIRMRNSEIDAVLSDLRNLFGRAHTFAKNSGLTNGPSPFLPMRLPRTPPARAGIRVIRTTRPRTDTFLPNDAAPVTPPLQIAKIPQKTIYPR
jgi:hypothetical protein